MRTLFWGENCAAKIIILSLFFTHGRPVKEGEPPAMVSVLQSACMCFPEKRIKWQTRGERNWRKLQYGRRNLDKYCWRATIMEALKHCVLIFFSIWKVFLSNFQFFNKNKKKKQRVFLNPFVYQSKLSLFRDVLSHRLGRILASRFECKK